MTQTALSLETLQQHIAQDINACRQLLRLLEEERQALQARETDKLETVIQEKATNLALLEQNAKQRSAWVARQIKPEEKPEAAWLALIRSIRPETTRDWQQFKELLRQCQEQNEINGKLLARNQQIFSRLLAIVRGQNDSAALYSAKGNRGAGYNFQKLGEA